MKIIIYFLFTTLFISLNAQDLNQSKDFNKTQYDQNLRIKEIFTLAQDGNFTQSLKLLRPLAKEGNNIAMIAIGNFYKEGKGVEKDLDQTVLWYKKALKAGNKEVKFHLANFYKDGIGVKKSNFKAFNLYLQSALELDNKKAMFFVAAMYYEGKGVAQNFDKSFFWAYKAAQRREPRSAFLLGLSYMYGNGVEKDLVEALEYANMSKQLGNVQAPKLVHQIRDAMNKEVERSLSNQY